MSLQLGGRRGVFFDRGLGDASGGAVVNRVTS